MKRFIISFFFMLSALFSSTAAAAWYAEASSNNGWGWGSASTRYEAERIAMYNCRIHTPNWDYCYITVSRPN